MKLHEPVNEAYAATIVKLENTYPLENSDRLVGSRFFGYSAVIPKDYPLGLYVMFSAETQLSEEYCRENNLFRHGNLNKDQSKTGYIEDNRRIRAIKLRGNTSNCVIMPLESLAYTGVDISQFKENDTFDHLADREVCKKYVVKSTAREIKTQTPKFSRVDKRLMPEHIKTVQYFRHSDQFKDKMLVVTQKIHGTSVRISNIPVAKELSWKDRIAKKLGINISEQEYDYVYGSRRVIKDSRGEQQHFYDEDLWTSTGERVKDSVPKNYILYGEIIGWVNEHKPIQPNYTYNLKPGTSELYIYRVATVNPDGFVTDLSWDGVKEFCKERGLNHVPELTRSIGWNETVTDHYMNKRYYDEGFTQAVPLSDPKTKDEGICIRYEAQIPVIAKAKCSEFLGHETKVLDQQQEDLEQS